jgi:hypothetical protein
VSLVGLTFLFGAVAQAQEKQTGSWGSVGGGYIYLLTEGTTSHWTSTHGWYVLPTFNINKQVSVFADFANFYGKGQNIHADPFGPIHAFSSKTRYAPFIFTGIGRIRDSRAGTITNSEK